MAMTPIPKPLSPNVPLAPGVPSVFRTISHIENTIVILTASVKLIAQAFEGPQWGIFDSQGQPLLFPDTVVGYDHRKEFRVSSFPVEKGSFANYNKVEHPYDGKVTMTIGKTEDDRANFLIAVDALVRSLKLVVVITPEVVYLNANAIHYDYKRSQKNGATLLTVDVWLQEIREVDTTKFVETHEPTGQAEQNNGTVQAGQIKPPNSGSTTTTSSGGGTGLRAENAPSPAQSSGGGTGLRSENAGSAVSGSSAQDSFINRKIDDIPRSSTAFA